MDHFILHKGFCFVKICLHYFAGAGCEVTSLRPELRRRFRTLFTINTKLKRLIAPKLMHITFTLKQHDRFRD
jgi:hypothetical protein